MNKKEIVIDTARELFTKYGYKKVSMDEIAKEANVTKKTIYTYFKDKEDMFKYFVQEELMKMKAVIEEEESTNSSFLEIFSTNIYYMLTFRKNSVLFSNIFKEAKEVNAIQCNNFLKLYNDEIIKYIEDKIIKGMEDKQIKKCNAHLTAFIIYRVYIAVMFEYEQEIEEKEVTKEITSILSDGLFN